MLLHFSVFLMICYSIEPLAWF